MAYNAIICNLIVVYFMHPIIRHARHRRKLQNMAESVESELELEIDKIEALRNFEGALASISTIFVILSVI